MPADTTLSRLVAEDRALDAQQKTAAQRHDSASLALMEHRWKAVNQEHDGKRYSMRAYSRALDHKSPDTVRKYVRGWELWQLNSNTEFGPGDLLVIAQMSEQQRQAMELVAASRGLKMVTVANLSRYRDEARQVRGEIDAGAAIFEQAGIEPKSARQLAKDEVRERLTELHADAGAVAEVQARRQERQRERAQERDQRSAFPAALMRLNAGANAIEEMLGKLAALDLDTAQAEQVDAELDRIRTTIDAYRLLEAS